MSPHPSAARQRSRDSGLAHYNLRRCRLTYGGRRRPRRAQRARGGPKAEPEDSASSCSGGRRHRCQAERSGALLRFRRPQRSDEALSGGARPSTSPQSPGSARLAFHARWMPFAAPVRPGSTDGPQEPCAPQVRSSRWEGNFNRGLRRPLGDGRHTLRQVAARRTREASRGPPGG